MVDLVASQILGLAVGFLSIIPAAILLRQFFKTRIRDYFLFFLFFADAFITLTLDVIAGYLKELLFVQLHHITIDIIYVILIIHGSRIIWKNIPIPLLVITLVWFFALMILTLMWQITPAVRSGNWLGIQDFPISFSDYAFSSTNTPNLAAGVFLGNIIIYGTQFRIFGDSFRIFSIILLIYAYVKADTLSPTPKILKAKKIWIVSWVLLLIHAIVLFPPFGETSLGNLVGLSLIIGGILITYIALFIPEGILISSVQVQRVFDLYAKIQGDSNEEEIEKLKVESLMIYLMSIKEALKDIQEK